MAATLANGGVNPHTRERALDPRYLRDVLSVMFTSGLYDASGQGAYRIGLPAKSGVSGGLLAVVPGRLGIGIWSPPIDERGNSVRALRVCEDLSRRFGLHALASSPPRPALDRAALEVTLVAVHQEARDARDGALATYIPALAEVDPDAFAVALCTVDGHTLVAGDHGRRFTLQSVANPFCYGLALEQRGRELVERFVNVEPSGNPFNAIALDPRTNRPPNPMINAGAIGIAALQPGADPDDRLRRLLDRLAPFAGRPLDLDHAVLDSEWATADRNRSIAYLMRNFGMLAGGDLDGALRLYLQSCAVLVDCRDLAIMAGTLANGGVNPVTGALALAPEHLRDVLSVMLTCGMNEWAGEWTYRVGLPAKSGVGGGVLAVVPGALGIAVFSPRLDARGNSVRGLRVCEALAQRLRLHVFER
jgi:glutaminase A